MATAKLVLPDGTTVNIEGNADEVALLLQRLSGGRSAPGAQASAAKPARKARTVTALRPGRKGPTTLLEELAAENYFKAKRTIGEVQKKLEERGHIYPLHALSTPLLRLARSKVLRRIKEKSGWVYVS